MKPDDRSIDCLRWLVVVPLLLTCNWALGAAAELSAKPASILKSWADQGDGTYVNPIVPADFSDLDAIRVENDFYAISSTFQFSPGVVILHSTDLVSWQIVGHAVDDLTRISPELNWNQMNRYAHGIWAGAIRYHSGRFWIYFGTPDEGFFVTSSEKAAGPWEPLRPLWLVKGWDDCCPFWDDDGKGYFVCSNFAGGYKIHLFRLSDDGLKLLPGVDSVIHQSRGSEANKLYKIDGLYYHYFSEIHAEGRVAMMERAKTLAGPWEIHQLNHVNKKIDKEPNQGGLIQLASGDWWFVTHQGTGDWEGRAMVLLPVTWIDGWPIIGAVGTDGIGNMIWRNKKPIAGNATFFPQSNDEFALPALAPQWEWNYQPRADKWSLTEHRGYLRLHAFQPLKPDDLLKVGNILTQRSMRTQSNQVTVELNLAGMVDGQSAGICHFAKSYSGCRVAQSGGVRRLTILGLGKPTDSKSIDTETIWLGSEWDFSGESEYIYSTDGAHFTKFGPPYRLAWGNYRGDRIGLFTYNNLEDAGYVDFRRFVYSFSEPQEPSTDQKQ